MDLEHVAKKCLIQGDRYQHYSDDDLVNATIIFNHFLMDHGYRVAMSLPFEMQLEKATKTGKAVRDIIIQATGKDMHELVKPKN